jgi:hypothetical protein
MRIIPALWPSISPSLENRGGEGWGSLRGSLEAGFAAQLGPSIGLPGRAHFHVRAAGGGRPCPPGHLEPLLR